MGIVPGMGQEERDAAMFRGYGQGAREAAPVAGAIALPIVAPSLAAWAGSPLGGATIGGVTTALKGGGPVDILKGAGIGAGTSGVFGVGGKFLKGGRALCGARR